MLTAEQIRNLRNQRMSVAEIAVREGVGKNAIYARLEHDEKPWLSKARDKKYRKTHPYVYNGTEAEKSAARRGKNICQNKTLNTANLRYQPWTTQEIRELEKRIAGRRNPGGETILQIALEMERTYKGIGRAIHRFGLKRI